MRVDYVSETDQFQIVMISLYIFLEIQETKEMQYCAKATSGY